MIRIITKLLLVTSFVTFLYAIFQAAASYYDKEYMCWILFLAGGILSYQSYRHFINSLDEENHYN